MHRKLIDWTKLTVIPAIFGVAGAAIFSIYQSPKIVQNVIPENPVLARSVSMGNTPGDFVKASTASTPCVVFIKNESEVTYGSPFGWFWDFDPFGSRGQATSTGSGVIVSKDGYIVTNNHVINGATKLTVVLNGNKTEYPAKVIGKDPSSDLALIKIEASNLPFITIGNSDNMQVGDWVIAVGNPFNLNSTVTAGIVSAKGRNINIVQNQFPIESFIQTDAAINPGNSGGALVNLAGELIGINTAIQSNTGSYAGYGFAIPSNIVSKIIKDFMEFGEVQRAFSGMVVDEIPAAKQKELGNGVKGVIVNELTSEGPAEKEGIQIGDVIIKVGNKDITSKAYYDEELAYFRPGDEVKVIYLRDGKEKEATIKLISKNDNTALIQKGAVNSKQLGASFQPLTKSELEKLKITSGIRVINVLPYKYIQQAGLEEGFVITGFNGKTYTEAEELIEAMESNMNRWKIEGMDKAGRKRSFYLSFY